MRGRRAAGRALACVMGDMDLVRPLGLAGVPCAVVARRGDPTRFSRFTHAVLQWVDPWDQPEALVETLLRFAATQSAPPVLFYEDDPELLLVSRYRDVLRPAFRYVVADATLVEDLVDKARFQALADQLDLPVPIARSLDPARRPNLEDCDIPFPVVIKPLTRRTDHWASVGGPGKALQVDTLEALRQVWPRVVAGNVPILAQQLVPGPETAVESYHVYVDEQGEIVGEFTGRKIRTWPPQYGYSTALAITDAPEITALGRKLVRRVDLRGVAKLDFKWGPDGRLYLLEINPRFTLWHHPGALAGVNLPALVYGDLAGLPRPAVPRAQPGIHWCRFWRDRRAARAAGVRLARWLPWILRCPAKRVLSWDDPLPLLCAGTWAVARGLADGARRAFHRFHVLLHVRPAKAHGT